MMVAGEGGQYPRLSTQKWVIWGQGRVGNNNFNLALLNFEGAQPVGPEKPWKLEMEPWLS